MQHVRTVSATPSWRKAKQTRNIQQQWVSDEGQAFLVSFTKQDPWIQQINTCAIGPFTGGRYGQLTEVRKLLKANLRWPPTLQCRCSLHTQRRQAHLISYIPARKEGRSSLKLVIRKWGSSPTAGQTCPSSPLARTSIKALKMRETNPPVVLTRALLTHTLRRHKQWHHLRAQSLYDDLHTWTPKHAATSGRPPISIHKIPSSAPNNRKTWSSRKHRKWICDVLRLQKSGSITSRVVPTRDCSHKGGGGYHGTFKQVKASTYPRCLGVGQARLSFVGCTSVRMINIFLCSGAA